MTKQESTWYGVAMVEMLGFIALYCSPYKTLVLSLLLLANLIGIASWFYATFFGGGKPLHRFKIFLRRKINEGENLYNSSLPDVITKRLADGSMDQNEIIPFRDRNTTWKASVFGGLTNALSKETRASFKGPFHTDRLTPSAILFGGFRIYLREDIEFLKTMKREVKSDWLDDKFIPDNLAEYES